MGNQKEPFSKTPLNPNEIWLPIEQVIQKKKVTKRMVLKAMDNGKLDWEFVATLNKNFIFIVVNDKYKSFSHTSKYKLDLNALIDFTNKRLRGKV